MNEFQFPTIRTIAITSEIMDREIWPRLLCAGDRLENLKTMLRLRTVSKAWLEYVQLSEAWFDHWLDLSTERMCKVRMYVPVDVECRSPLCVSTPDVTKLNIGLPMTVDEDNEKYAVGPIEEYVVTPRNLKRSFVYDLLD